MIIRMLSTTSICGIKPEILAARAIVFNALERAGCEHVVLSSIRDGVHSAGSRHYMGMAEDYDPVSFTPDRIKEVSDVIRKNLSSEYDVVAHGTHIHVEYDPKSNTRV